MRASTGKQADVRAEGAGSPGPSPRTREFTLAEVDDLLPGEARVVERQGLSLALFNVDGTFYVTENTCLHRGGPLGDGFLEGAIVTCPWHGRRYDVRTGENLGIPSLRVRTFPVTVENGEVKVRI